MNSRIVGGIRVYAPSCPAALIDFALDNHGILVAVNAEKIVTSSAEVREIINRNIGYPDGVGAVIALKKKGVHDAVKIAGCELWLEIIRQHYHDKEFYLVGGKEEVIQSTVEKLRHDFPAIRISGYRNGYLERSDEKEVLLQKIAEKKPDVVFVAMGSPRQEVLMEEMRLRHPALYQGLGGSFDVYAGYVERAPRWWIEHHLEWLYRLLRQPTRVTRQVHYLRFMLDLITKRL